MFKIRSQSARLNLCSRIEKWNKIQSKALSTFLLQNSQQTKDSSLHTIKGRNFCDKESNLASKIQVLCTEVIAQLKGTPFLKQLLTSRISLK